MTIELNNAFLQEGNQFSINFKKIDFFLKNMWIIRMFRLFFVIRKLQAQVADSNGKLRYRIDSFKKILDQVHSIKFTARKDCSDIITTLNKEITTYSNVKAHLTTLLSYNGYKILGDFDTTNAYVDEMLGVTYDLIRVLKIRNKKVSIPTSQLAKDTAAHSVNTLTALLNGN